MPELAHLKPAAEVERFVAAGLAATDLQLLLEKVALLGLALRVEVFVRFVMLQALEEQWLLVVAQAVILVQDLRLAVVVREWQA